MEKPFPAYKGKEEYVFVCYSHSDSGAVYPDLEQLRAEGIHVWYDEGIPAGSSWRGEIAQAITGASRLVFFISPDSIVSEHCLREVDYALNQDVPIIPVYLEDTQLPPELDLVLSRVQGLFRQTDERFMQHLLGAIRGGPERAPYSTAKKRRRSGTRPLTWVLGTALVFLTAWQAIDYFEIDEPVPATPATGSNAFNTYLEGLELMERWDKGDNLQAAIDSFAAATEQDPEFALAHARLAEAYRMQYALTRDQEKLDLALASINEALRIDPALAPVQVSFGKIQATQGNMDLAFDALNRALQIDPNDATANAAIARLYERLGRVDDAESHFRKSLALDPENLLNIDSFANFLFRRSRYEEAIGYWQKVIQIAPDHYSALVNLGSAMSQSGQNTEAISMYKRAIAIKPSFMAYSNLGTSYARQDRFQEAVEALEKALEIDPTSSLAWGNLGFVYAQMNGMDAQTQETLDHAIEMAEADRNKNPRDPFVNSDLALYYAKTGNAELARERIGTALTLAPDTGAILLAGAEVHEMLGERAAAVKMLRQALDNGVSMQYVESNPELNDLLENSEL